MDYSNSGRFLFCMLAFFVCGAVVFMAGFFPVSSHTLDRVVNNDARPTQLEGYRLVPPRKVYAQTILILIDALRYDFLNATSTPFAYGNACSRLKICVSTPTVTMPRLKSLTTGTVSSFIDIVLNIGHVEQLPDSLLHRLRERGDILSFGGDHTWIKLFPNTFQRQAANVDSFFVNDFDEGDSKVFTVLNDELRRSDWTLLILHFLGLDHIGHVEGSTSWRIPRKLIDIDSGVRTVYDSEHYHNQLLLLTADHGMRDGGGHGGSTGGEIYVPLYIFKQNCTTRSSPYAKTNEYNQIDLAPTLAILFSIEIPTVSIGCLIPELLQDLSLEDQLYAYYYNTLHLLRKITRHLGEQNLESNAYGAWFIAAKEAHKEFLEQKRTKNVENAFLFERARLEYMRTSREISEQMSDSLVRFNYGLIAVGLALTTLVVAHTLSVFIIACTVQTSHQSCSKLLVPAAIAVALCINVGCHYMQYIESSKLLYSCLLMLPITAAVYVAFTMICLLAQAFLQARTTWRRQQLKMPWLLLNCLAFHTLSLSSSSFIERECKTWYYLGVSVLVVLCAEVYYSKLRMCGNNAGYLHLLRQLWQLRFMVLIIIILLLLNKLSHLNGILSRDYNKLCVSGMLAFGLFQLWICLEPNKNPTQHVFSFMALVCVYCYRGSHNTVIFVTAPPSSDTASLCVIWASICVGAGVGCKSLIIRKPYHTPERRMVKCLQACLTALLLISALLHRPHNVVLIASMILALNETYKLCDALQLERAHNYDHSYITLRKAVYTMLLANMFFFYQGNSNSFATIDLNPGYIGQSSYNPIVVGIFVTLNMYSAPICAFLYLVVHVIRSCCTNDSALTKRNNGLGLPESVDVWFIIHFYTVATILPVVIYLWLLVYFRYHLFIYSVFAPKAFYECYRVIVFYLVLSLTNISLTICK